MNRKDARMIAVEVVNLLNKSKPFNGEYPQWAKEALENLED